MSAEEQPQQTPAAAKPPTLEEFVDLHKQQLEAFKLPKLLWKVLHRKLFQPKLIPDEDLFELEHLETGGFQLKAKKALRKCGDVYIIPHAAEGTDENLFKLFKAAPAITQYLADMIDLDLITTDPAEHRKQLIEKAHEMIKVADEQRSEKLTGIDEEMITTVMEQAEVDRVRAEQALAESQGDLVAAIADCLMTPEHKALEQSMNKNLFDQQTQMKGHDLDYQASKKRDEEYQRLQDDAVKARDLVKQLEELDIAEKSRLPQTDEERYIQRCAHLYQALFQNHFVGVYYTMKPPTEDKPFTGEIKPEDLIRTYYIMEAMGSAVIGSATPNVDLHCFICMSSGNSSWSILWPTKDIKAGEVIQRGALVPVKCPLDFKW